MLEVVELKLPEATVAKPPGLHVKYLGVVVVWSLSHVQIGDDSVSSLDFFFFLLCPLPSTVSKLKTHEPTRAKPGESLARSLSEAIWRPPGSQYF